jgi:hypothetical protein
LKRFYLITLLLCNIALYGQVDSYLNDYRLSGNSNFNKEQHLLAQSEPMYKMLLPFLQDSMLHVRQKAYSFLYREGKMVSASEREPYISALLNGCKDPNGSVIGQNIVWLQSFHKSDFTIESKELITTLLRNNRLPHRQRLIMLAGYVDAGRELMKRQLLQPDLSRNDQWYLSLALARLGDTSSVDFCLKTLQSQELNNQLVEFVLPDIIYTRQKKLLDVCIEYVNSDELSCFSSDPDNEASMLCGYRVLELIAPVLVDFPIQVNAIGTLNVPDYEDALLIARKWFLKHPDYLINTDYF